MKESTRKVYDKTMKSLGEAVVGVTMAVIINNVVSGITNKIKNKKSETVSGVKLVHAEKEED